MAGGEVVARMKQAKPAGGAVSGASRSPAVALFSAAGAPAPLHAGALLCLLALDSCGLAATRFHILLYGEEKEKRREKRKEKKEGMHTPHFYSSPLHVGLDC